MPTSLRSALPLLRGAGCFSADTVESLGNCLLQCHCRPTYSWSPISTSGRLITYTLVPSTCNVPPASEGCGMRPESKELPINALLVELHSVREQVSGSDLPEVISSRDSAVTD
jgi:hypothetical protein